MLVSHMAHTRIETSDRQWAQRKLQRGMSEDSLCSMGSSGEASMDAGTHDAEPSKRTSKAASSEKEGAVQAQAGLGPIGRRGRQVSLGAPATSLLMPSTASLTDFRRRARAELRSIAAEVGAGDQGPLGTAGPAVGEHREGARGSTSDGGHARGTKGIGEVGPASASTGVPTGPGPSVGEPVPSSLEAGPLRPSTPSLGSADAELKARVRRSRELRRALLLAHQQASLRRRAELWSVSWSPCGRYVVTGSEDRTARVIVADTGRGRPVRAPEDSDMWWDASAPLPWESQGKDKDKGSAPDRSLGEGQDEPGVLGPAGPVGEGTGQREGAPSPGEDRDRFEHEAQCVAVLRGHTFAVTAVSWEQLPAGSSSSGAERASKSAAPPGSAAVGSAAASTGARSAGSGNGTLDRVDQVLVTASDDKTVRVYDGGTLRLIRAIQLDTSEAFDTITYSAVLAKSSIVLSVTEAGYLFAHSLADGSQLFGAKINMGSCEGLSCIDQSGTGSGSRVQIAICGASCSVTAHEISFKD